MGKKLRATLISTLICLAILSVIDISFDIIENVSSETFYVNTTGSGGAFTSIQDAINASNDGDTVFVYSGVYYEILEVNRSVNLTGENKENTVIDGRVSGNVITITASYANITGFTITNGSDGIYIDYSTNTNIKDNIISNNKGWAVCIWSSLNLNITNNDFTNAAIFIYGNELSYYNTHNITPDNVVDGEPVYYYKNSNNVTIDNISAGEIILVNCTHSTIRNLYLNACGAGIALAYSKDTIIDGNDIPNNGEFGIHLWYSSHNEILNNNVSNNYFGIYVESSYYNNITNNNVSNNWYGIYNVLSNYNNITGNRAVMDNWEGITISSSFYNNIRSNNVSNIDVGIYFVSSDYNKIINNVASWNNGYGIRLSDSMNNIISNNNFSWNNLYGIRIWSSIKNRIYHNNIINNTDQAADDGNGNFWDNGYPSGGNYWSDYAGVDNFKGPKQDIPGKDSIGDTNYSIDSDSIDNYPLIRPYQYFPTENYTILKQGWNLISIPLIQEEQNLTRVLGSIHGWYDAVQWYDVTDISDIWKHQKVSKPFGNDLFEINEKMGFWIHITQPGDTIFIYNGTQPTSNQTIQLYPGWNLVGYPSLTHYNRTDGLNNLTFGTEVDSIWTYNTATQKWKGIGPSDYFEIGKGYWIHAKTKCEWEVPL